MNVTILRPVYTTEQFLTEILGNNRSPDWIRMQCRTKRIKTVAKRPFLIPQSEAKRFISPE